MTQQFSFAETEFAKGAQKSCKGQFLEQMERCVTRAALAEIITPYYVKEPKIRSPSLFASCHDLYSVNAALV